MKLSVKNIGKINFAEVEISGITVIGGLNNTGKSTISKSLFAIFNSLHDLSRQVWLARVESISDIFRRNINFFDEFFREDSKIDHVKLSELIAGLTDEKEIENIMIKNDISQSFYKEVMPGVVTSNSLDPKNIAKEIVSKVFRDEFNNRIQNIYSKERFSEVVLETRDSKFKIGIDGDGDVDFDNSKELTYEVVYIDDPFIIDSHNLGIFGRRSSRGVFIPKYDHVKFSDHRNLLLNQLQRDDDLVLVEKATIRSRIQDIYGKINTILGDTNKVVFSNRGYRQFDIPSDQLPVDSLSAGMKTFYLIKLLLDNGTIVENGTLILDEPEVHLHPDWQLNMAEIIVLLQRELKLHILINTHSPYFLRAIDVYSRKYDVVDKTNYYLSSNNDEYAVLNKVEDIAEIYKILTEPLQRLENERI